MIFFLRPLLLLVTLPVLNLIAPFDGKDSPAKNEKVLELVSFEAISDGKKVIVNWSSLGERTFDYYTIEKSKDGIHFYPALMIKSAGTLSNPFEYTDVDYSPFTGISYYRLRQNDYFGEYSYSPTTAVNCQMLKDGSLVAQTEISGLQKELKAMEGKPVLVVVRDNKGTEFISKILVSIENGELYAKDVKDELAHGDYFVVASSCNPLFHQKLIVK